MTKKLLAFILSFALLLSVVSVGIAVPTLAEGEIKVWSGDIAEDYAGGDGSKETPYLISNGEELAYMYQTVQVTGSAHSNNKYFKLTADIYLNDVSDPNWMNGENLNSWYASISTNNFRFTGNFDGDGHTVYGMYYNGSEGNIGLLPVMDNWNYDVTVKGLTISDAYINTTGNIVGVVSPRLYSNNNKIAHFYNINITDSVIATGGDYVGGILGFSNCNETSPYQFSGCAVRANISSGHALIGYGSSATVAKIVQSYTTATDWYPTNSTQGKTAYIVSADDVKGKDAAKEAMPNLDWLRMWGCSAEGYPFPYHDFDTNNKAGLVWTGFMAADYAGGSGTEEDPYIINTPEQLVRILKIDLTGNKYFKLGADIYLNDVADENWTENSPNSWFDRADINKTAFVGTIDGADHTIYGLYYNGSNIFGLLPQAENTTIKNLRISKSDITSASHIAAFIGFPQTKVTFSRCIVDETVNITGSADTAGFVAYGSPTIVIDSCAGLANITGATNVGALVGDCWTATNVTHKISNSFGKDYPLDAKLGYTSTTPSYGTVQNIRDPETTGILESADLMKGTAARENMPKLAWVKTWQVDKNGGFPILVNPNPDEAVPGAEWSGLVATGYAGGTGAENDPYIIKTGEQLAYLITQDTATSGQYYALGADILLNDISYENWTESAKSWYNSGQVAAAFAGTLDGAAHTVRGIYYNGTGLAGLIPKSAEGATIKNLIVSNSYLNNTGTDNNHNVSGIVSYVTGATTFDSCIVDETVTLVSGGSATGLAGWGSANITITNCGVSASITGSSRNGAMIGNFWGGTQTVNNSYSVGTAISTYRAYSGSNNYSTADSGKGPVTVLSEEQMKGENARVNMPALKFFGVTDTYPVIYQQGTKGEVWTGSVAYSYAGGNGTKESPYIIETGEQLTKLVNDPNTAGKYYTITADIKLNDTSADNWTATATPWFAYNTGSEITCKFAGTLNGDFNTISGLYYSGTGYYVGLFGGMGASGVSINRVVIDNSYLETTNMVSAFTGYVYGEITYNECVVGNNVTIKGDHASGYGSYGSGNVTVNNSMALADVTGTNYGGAFFADIWSSTLKINNSIGIGTFSPRRSYTGSNNYGTVEDSYGVNVVTVEQMQGPDALTNMDKLTGYYVSDTFPVRYYDGLEGATWSGGAAKNFASGSGTKEDPYVIKTGEQLAKMLTSTTKNNCYVLGADIVLSDADIQNNWLDSSNSEVFSGNFNGNGYIISGLYYNKEVTSNINAGLVPKASGAYLSNIILENSSVNMVTNGSSLATYAGGIVGYVTGTRTTIYCSYIADSVVISNTRAASTTSNNAVGGFIGGGQAAPVTIDGCAFFGTLQGLDYRYGALFGDIWGGVENDRIVKNTIVANVTPASRWSFTGEKNVSTVASVAEDNDSFTLVDSLKGDAGIKAVNETANWNDRYFGTEEYPVLSTLAKRFGDVDGNRIADDADIAVIRKYLIGASEIGYVDVNGDGKKNIADLVRFNRKLVVIPEEVMGYSLVWNDEFDGDALDATKWSTQTRMSDTTELAQSNISAVRKVDDGKLQLTAMENTWYNPNSESAFEQHKYMTSGSVTTEGKMSYQYGYLEIRAKVPYKEGCWPSFWLRSHNSTGKQENAIYEVEVDVFEVFGSRTGLVSNLHQQNYNGSSYQTNKTNINNQEKYTFANTADLSNEYHIYAFEWTPDRMAVYVDGVLNCEWKLKALNLWGYGLKTDTSGFNTTMNILFNNHLFTQSSEYKPSDESNIIENYEENLPAEFDIDYVRLYQKDDGLSKLIIE